MGQSGWSDSGRSVFRGPPSGGGSRSSCAPAPLPDPANILELMIAPGPVRDAVANWPSVVPALLERCRREAVGGVLDGQTSRRIERLRQQPDVAALLHDVMPAAAAVPVIDVVFALGASQLSFFSVVSTIGTPQDVTAQELRVEAFFPSDAATQQQWTTG